jgi:hypothetical protein
MMHTAVFIKSIQKKALQGEFKDQPEATTLATAVAKPKNMTKAWTCRGPIP